MFMCISVCVCWCGCVGMYFCLCVLMGWCGSCGCVRAQVCIYLYVFVWVCSCVFLFLCGCIRVCFCWCFRLGCGGVGGLCSPDTARGGSSVVTYHGGAARLGNPFPHNSQGPWRTAARTLARCHGNGGHHTRGCNCKVGAERRRDGGGVAAHCNGWTVVGAQCVQGAPQDVLYAYVCIAAPCVLLCGVGCPQ